MAFEHASISDKIYLGFSNPLVGSKKLGVGTNSNVWDHMEWQQKPRTVKLGGNLEAIFANTNDGDGPNYCVVGINQY